MPQFAFPVPVRLALPTSQPLPCRRHQDTLRFLITVGWDSPAGLAHLPPSPSLCLDALAVLILCVLQSAGHTSLHARQSLPWLCPSPSGPSSPLLCCDVCVHARLPHGPGGPARSPPPAACRPSLAHEHVLFGLVGIGLHRVLNFHELPTFNNHDFP